MATKKVNTFCLPFGNKTATEKGDIFCRLFGTKMVTEKGDIFCHPLVPKWQQNEGDITFSDTRATLKIATLLEKGVAILSPISIKGDRRKP